MALNFVVETGSADPDASSYCTVAFASDYIGINQYKADEWAALEEDAQQNLLMRSSLYLDTRFRWNGQRVDRDSGLKWPRAGVYDDDNFVIPDDVIPTVLQQAVCEMATYLMDEDWTQQRTTEQFRELHADVLDIKFNQDFRRGYIPDTLIQMLLGLGFANSGRKPMFKPIVRT
jgi:hypothetical protein